MRITVDVDKEDCLDELSSADMIEKIIERDDFEEVFKHHFDSFINELKKQNYIVQKIPLHIDANSLKVEYKTEAFIKNLEH